MESTSLYRHFDGDGRLLYVGISRDAIRRLGEHGRAKWADRITRVDIEKFTTRQEAIDAGRRAIRDEAPECNLQSNPAIPSKSKGTSVNVRVSSMLREKLEGLATDEKRTLSGYVLKLLQEHVEVAEKTSGKRK
jgi:hypothetical protein